MVGGDAVEPGLGVSTADGISRAGKPVTKIPVSPVAVGLVGPFRAVGIHQVSATTRQITFQIRPIPRCP